MRTMIDIPDDVLKDTMALTHASNESEAVVSVLRDYVRRAQVEALLKDIGDSTTMMTQQDLADMRAGRGKYDPSR